MHSHSLTPCDRGIRVRERERGVRGYVDVVC